MYWSETGIEVSVLLCSIGDIDIARNFRSYKCRRAAEKSENEERQEEKVNHFIKTCSSTEQAQKRPS